MPTLEPEVRLNQLLRPFIDEPITAMTLATIKALVDGFTRSLSVDATKTMPYKIAINKQTQSLCVAIGDEEVHQLNLRIKANPIIFMIA